MAPTEPEVTAYGWELHSTRGGSDKFYRFLVFLHEGQAGVMFITGRYGQSPGTIQKHTVAEMTPQQAVAEAVKQLRSKVNGSSSYEMQTRGFTAFQVPTALAARDTRGTASSAAAICRLFRDAARAAMEEYDEAAPIS